MLQTACVNVIAMLKDVITKLSSNPFFFNSQKFWFALFLTHKLFAICFLECFYVCWIFVYSFLVLIDGISLLQVLMNLSFE